MNGTSNGYEEIESFKEIQIPVPWGQISGKWWGPRNVQPVLAIHGWQDNAGTFDALAPLLVKKGHSLLCIDLPGHGNSSHFADGHYYYIFWDGVHLVRRIVKHFKWSNITIMGHSLGGGIGFLYSASFPNDVKKYISFDIASPSVRSCQQMVDSIGGAVDKFLKYETLTMEQMPCYKYDDMLDIVFQAYAGSVTKEGCKIMLKRGMKQLEDGRYFFTRDPRLKVAALGFLTQDQVLEFCSRITCDVLNIRGNPGMKFQNPEFYDRVLDAIEIQARKVERHLVEGTHHLHLNNPERIVNIVDVFLKS